MLLYGLERVKFVERLSFLRDNCDGKRVLHLGATDAPYTKEAVVKDRLLHNHIGQVSSYLIGMDINRDMIKWLANSCGIQNIKEGDIEKIEDYPEQDFDVIIAGEILEHLSNPGKALDGIRSIIKPNCKLIITVPNAYSFKGFVRVLMRKHELIHPDHALHHSPHTLKALLERHGFTVETYFSFVNGGTGPLASIANFFLRFHPQLAEGIGVICSPSNSNPIL